MANPERKITYVHLQSHSAESGDAFLLSEKVSSLESPFSSANLVLPHFPPAFLKVSPLRPPICQLGAPISAKTKLASRTLI